MSLLRKLFWGFALILNLPQAIEAQIPDSLKQPYWDLVKLNNSRQYQTAILQGKMLVAQVPQFPYTYGQLALAFEKAEHLEQGHAFFDSLRQRNPDNPYVYYAIAMLEKDRKNFEQAVGNLKVCIKFDPQYAPAYMQLAEIYNEQKDLETPVNYFRALLQEDSLNAAAYYGLGCVYNLKRDWTKGAEAFTKCLDINPNLTPAYYLNGVMLANQRNYQQALAIWDKGKDMAAKLNEIQMQGFMTGNVGNMYHEMGQWQKFIPYREEALKLARALGDKRQEERHLSNLGNSYTAIGEPRKAIELYDQGLAIARELNDKDFEETLLGNKSAALGDMARYKEAIESAMMALKMAESKGDSLAVSSHSWNIGAAYVNLASFPEALQNYQRALRIRRAVNDLSGVCELLVQISNAYKDMGEIATAIDTLQIARQIAHDISSTRQERLVLGSLGYAYSGLSDYTQAHRYFQRALFLADSLKEVLAKGTYLGNIGLIYKKWGNFTKALDYLNQALAQDKKIGNSRGVVRHYTNQANIFEIRGDFVKALNLHKKTLAISDSIGTRNYTSVVLGNIGVIYNNIGDLDQALFHFEKALKLAQEISAKEFIPPNLAQIGTVYDKLGKDTEALEKFNESLKAAEAIGNDEQQVTALTSIGVIWGQRKEHAKALQYYNQALALTKKIGNKNQEGRLYLNIGKTYLEKEEFSVALPYFQRALAIGKKMDAFDLMYESLGGIGAVAEKQKRDDEAIKYYDEAIDKIESVRERLKIESYKTQFLEDKLEVYESVITLLIRLGKFEKAYEYLQRFRSRSFLEILSPQRLDFAEGISPKRFARFRFWEQKLREIYDRLGVEYGKGEGKRNDKMIAALNDSLQRVRQEHEKICDEVRLHHPRAAELNGITQALNLQGIQQKVLQPGQTLVEYFVGPELVAVYVIQANTFHCEVLKVKREELENWVDKLREPFRQVKERIIKNLADVSYDLQLGQRLYERLFQPIEKYLTPSASLLIVPDGVLHYLPFEALVTGVEAKPRDRNILFSRYANAHYLIEKYAIAYAPSASILASPKRICENENNSERRWFGIGSPDFGRFKDSSSVELVLKASKGLLFAPLSDRDVREVEKIMQPASVFIGKDATEDRFKQAAGAATGIYLSTHAIVDENQPMYSLIAFAQDEDHHEDGFLHAYEVFNLCLNCDLVTLSACETGLGKLSRGEGLIGLTRGFIYAGAPSVLVSLWSVEESTAAIMKIFYQNLNEGMSKAEALRQAKLKLIRTRESGISFAHPFLWAPFVLVGDAK